MSKQPTSTKPAAKATKTAKASAKPAAKKAAKAPAAKAKSRSVSQKADMQPTAQTAPEAASAKPRQKRLARVTFIDMKTASSLCDLNQSDMAYYFGLSSGKLNAMANQPDLPVWSPTHAIVTRQLIDDPALCLLPRKITFKQTLDRINREAYIEQFSLEFGVRRKKELSARRLVLLMGLSISAEFRLMRSNEPSPIVSRLLQHINKLMDVHGGQKGFWVFVNQVRDEATSRGMTIANIFEDNSWGVSSEMGGRKNAEAEPETEDNQG